MKDRDEERNNYIVEGQQNTCIRPQFFQRVDSIKRRGKSLSTR